MVTQLNQLTLSNIRNLGEANLSFGRRFNVFIGANGSGKTSFLEAIHLLSVGRSFRTRSIQQIISFGAQQCLVRARVTTAAESAGIWLGMARDLNGEVQYKVGENTEKSAAELTRLLPVQLIDVNSPLLLDGGPNYRRQFLDWGAFHVEHAFLDSWRSMRRALEQRNAALKKKQRSSAAWDEAFIKHAMEVDKARQQYLEEFRSVFAQLLQEMLGMSGVELRYQRGWHKDQDLRTELAAAANMDLAYGYTTRGPQRADLDILIDGRLAKTVLSRGQLKIFVCIMLLARAKLLNATQAGVFLIDDLHAELDQKSCGVFISAVKSLDCQVFMTGIEVDLLAARLHGCEAQLFHVEQGHIRQAENIRA